MADLSLIIKKVCGTDAKYRHCKNPSYKVVYVSETKKNPNYFMCFYPFLFVE